MSVAQESEVRFPQKRAKVSFNLDKDDTDNHKDNGTIPIVELKPFVHKVWRREKSLPGFYEKMEVNLDRASPKSISKSSKDGDTYSDVMSQSETSISPPPRTAQSLPPRVYSQGVLVYVNTFSDFSAQKEHINRLIGESGYRPKSRIHPTADMRTMKQPEHSVNIIPGFITRDNRTKSTLTDITLVESMRKAYNYGPKSPEPGDFHRQQGIRIVGEPILNGKAEKMSPKGTSPARSLNSSWQGVRHGSPASILYHNKHKHSRGHMRSKTPLYDHLDREGTLPSLVVTAPGLNARSTLRYDDKDSDDYMDISDAYDRKYAHSVGGIENSLKLLSKHGKPTKVEHHLSRELESNLSRLRKSKDVSPFEINPAELAKYYPQNHAFNPTRGEVMIRQGLISNAPKRYRDRKRAAKEHKLFSQSASDVTHGILKKSFREIEHLDSYDREVFDLYKREGDEQGTDVGRTLETGMTENELMVPHDTPRTGPESQLSLIKTSEDLMRERDNGVALYDRKSVAERDIVPSTVDMNWPLKGGLESGLGSQHIGLDKDGRTFITSERGPEAV